MIDRSLSVVPAYLVRSDLMFLVAALIGLVAFLGLMPGQHPDTVGDAALGEEAAVDASKAFLEANGYVVEGLRAEATYRRQDEVVMAAQRRLGRRAAVEQLREASDVPAYHWRVRWHRNEDEPDRAGNRVFTTSHTSAGEAWAFEPEFGALNDGAERAVTAVDRAALARLADRELLEEMPDTVLQARLSFTTDDQSWATPLIRDDPGGALEEWLQADLPREPLTLTAGDAIAMARHHLAESALAGMPLQADSVWLVYDEGRPLPARTRFTGDLEQLGLSVEATVDVLPAGRLHGKQVEFGGFDHNDETTAIAGVSSSDIYNGITLIAYLLLVLVFIIVFVRRLSARLIDAQAALRDAVMGGVLALVAAAFAIVPVIWQETPNVGLALFAAGTTLSMISVAGAGAIFVISCAADAIARESWPAKLETLTRFRKVALRTVPSGLALVRGVLLGGVLLGLVALVLWVFPGVAIDVTQDDGLFPFYSAPFLVWMASYGWFALFLSLAVLLGVGTFLYGYRPSGPLVVVGIAVVFALIQAGPVSLEPAPAIGLVSLVVGMAAGWAFWRYSVLTGGLGVLLMYLGWQVLPGWLVAGSPIALAPVLLIGLVIMLLTVGLVGITSGQVGADMSQYVPDYIREMTQQQRLQRELEIAREVQQSFLPRRMPEVEGVDVAAMCLPANEVGGDYYDFVALGPDKLGVVIGDVSGKGIQAAFYMTLAKGFLQTLARSGRPPAEVLTKLNRLFYENAARGTFVSMIYGVLDIKEGTFTFARAGHTPLVKYCAEEETTELVRPRGLGIGLTRGGSFDRTIREQTLRLAPGDALVFYTDGFTEAMNRRKEQYGDSKLVRMLSDVGEAAASDILRRITDDVSRFVEGQGRHDDMTMVVLKLAPVDEQAQETMENATHITITP